MAKKLRLILGDQLNHSHSWYCKVDQDVIYVMMEVRNETDYVTHHIQKVIAFFAAMRNFSQWLSERGHQTHYIRLDDEENKQSFAENLKALVSQYNAESIDYMLPDEFRLDQELEQLKEALDIPVNAFDTEHFITERKGVAHFFKGKKQFLMESFYRDMRKKHGILMDGDKPEGGEWNYDKENREALDQDVEIPHTPQFRYDLQSIKQMIENAGISTLGTAGLDHWHWPLDRKDALRVLRTFCEEKLPNFGRYQDAMHSEHPFLFHSCLSFALNVKLLHPMEVVEKVIEAWNDAPDKISLPQVEGFVRQIIGWREFMRGIYWAHMPDFAHRNYLNHQRKLPEYFWTGETKMNCMKHAIGQSLEYAYAHHIQRLMVTGNFALLAGVDPSEVDAWYLGIYVDAIQWVQLPNTRGMSQFADGGIVGTKPYISSSNYIDKMSNYCRGCYYSKSKKTGEKACPFNSLYWNFYDRHRERFEKNHRVAMMYRTLDRMDAKKRSSLFKQASYYLDHIEDL